MIFRFITTALLTLPYILLAGGNDDVRGLQNSYAAIAKRAMPAVVMVKVYQQKGPALHQTSLGSGFFIRKNGYVLTNYHVIHSADAVVVQLNDATKYHAKIIGVSRNTDLAVLKINVKTRHPVLKFADSSTVQTGHCVVAIGAPFALSLSMTTGIVSGKGRRLGLHYQEDYIQTDAAINPGNSGGPLLDLDGNVVGVNDCILSNSNGIGFAIDGNLAKRIADMIISQADKEPAFGGMVVSEAKKGGKAYVSRVLPASPAAKSGVRTGDVIDSIDGVKINSTIEMQSLVLKKYHPGDRAVLGIIRKGKPMCITICFGRAK